MDTRSVTENILECLFHPAFPDPSSQIQKAMTEEFKQWFQSQGCEWKIPHCANIVLIYIACISQPAGSPQSLVGGLCQEQQEQAYRRHFYFHWPFSRCAPGWRTPSSSRSASSPCPRCFVSERRSRFNVRQAAWSARVRNWRRARLARWSYGNPRSTCLHRRGARLRNRRWRDDLWSRLWRHNHSGCRRLSKRWRISEPPASPGWIRLVWSGAASLRSAAIFLRSSATFVRSAAALVR